MEKVPYSVEKRYEDENFQVHEAEHLALSNTNYTDNLLRVDVRDCESLKKENDERAFLLYNILNPDECMNLTLCRLSI
jgi:hypothetical protein